MQDKMPTVNVVKEDFGWEVPVESVPLPSRGIIYNPDSKVYNTELIQIKAMTAHEEDILSSVAYLKEGSSVIKAIQSCIIDKSIDVADMILGDRNALMVSMRITGYGTDYNVNHSCISCNHNNPVTVKLDELQIKRLTQDPVSPGQNLFEYTLPVTKKKVLFKLLTHKDERESEIKRERLESAGIVTENAVTSYLENSIVSIDDVKDKNKISRFIKSMPAKDSRTLRLHMKDIEPGVDMTWEYGCNKCGHANKFSMPITSEFFWPST
jgi:hypothetical protein